MALTRRKLLFSGLIVAGLAILVLLVFTIGSAPPRIPLPNPNGYDDFLKAATLLTGDVSDISTLDHDGLQALVSTNAEALRLLRLGLTRSCSLPSDSAMTNVPGMVNDLARLKSLARLLVAEGRLAEMENRPGDAAHNYVDTIRFGNEMSRGGFIINRLVGIACEAIGCDPLVKLVPKLSCEQARPVIKELENIDATHVSWDEVRRNESRFSRYRMSKGFNPVTWTMAWRQRSRSIRKAAERHNRVIAHERLLSGEMALRCYQFEKSSLPARLDELVPNYLSSVPQDPFTGQPMIYHPHDTNWLLCSVGPDGVDDGGKPAGRGLSAKGDIFFDSFW